MRLTRQTAIPGRYISNVQDHLYVHVPQDSTFPPETDAVYTAWLFKILYIVVVFLASCFQWESCTPINTLSLRDFSLKLVFFYLIIILFGKNICVNCVLLFKFK